MVQRLGVMLVNFRLAFLSWLPSIALQDLTVGVLVASALKLVVYYRSKNAKKFRQGVEYGSARWGNRKDIEPFMDPVFENNVILTETERLTMNSRPKAPKYARNKNVIVIGGSGSGKTRFYVKPNLMQMTDHVSYVVTDPKGTIIVECGKMLVNGGYRIKVLNTINFKKSMHYNPFHYIRSEKDILKLVNTIIANTKGEGEKSTEDFWVKAERLLYSALIGYIWYEAPEEEQNFSTLLEFINASETREDDEEFKNAVDELFEELEAENPEHFAVRQYRKYKLAAGKTAKSILISCGARLAPFDIQELREIMSYDEMELDMIGDQRTAMFVIISDTDDTFNFVVAIMYTQLFNLLCDKADDEHNLVMASTFGLPLGDGAIRGPLKKLIEDYNLPPVVFHSFRHSSVTYKLKLNGGDIKAVQGDSGHAQVNMVTDVYSHILDDDRRKNAELFEEAFYEKKNLDPQMHVQQENNNATVADEVDPELLAKVLANPEMRALLNSLAKTMK